MQPVFSIGLVTYKRPQFLKECLESILSQTFTDFEVLIGNDDPDSVLTEEALGIQDPRIRILNHEHNLGEVRNMNALMHRACGRYFTWIADDDYYAPQFLKSISEAMQKYENPTCIYTSYAQKIDQLDKEYNIDGIQILKSEDYLRRYLSRDLALLGCCGAFETNWLKNVGGMQKLGQATSALYADHLLAIQSAQIDKVIFIPQKLILFRDHPESLSATSQDLRKYVHAQKDCLRLSKKVFAMMSSINPYSFYSLSLVEWFLKDNVAVIRRSEKISVIDRFVFLGAALQWFVEFVGTRYFLKYCGIFAKMMQKSWKYRPGGRWRRMNALNPKKLPPNA
jgi:glycosyltransferase involved in cell wall biosynthesis